MQSYSDRKLAMRFVLLIVAALLLCRESTGVEVSIIPPEGHATTPLGSTVDVAETDDGHEFTVRLVEGDISSPTAAFVWFTEDWVKLQIHSIERNSPSEPPPFFSLFFNPFNETGGIAVHPSTHHMQPRPQSARLRPYFLSLRVDGRCNLTADPCFQRGELRLRYSMETMPAPIPGDFNFDDRVDFADFLRISHGFGSVVNPGNWVYGDINLDGKLLFDDFLEFRKHYGNVRTSVATVPEPHAVRLSICGLCVVLLSRRRPRPARSISPSHRKTQQITARL